MIAAPFEYRKAASVEEALQLLQEYGDDAKLLAGGHSLLPTMKLRLATPAVLIDIGHLHRDIRDEGTALVLGGGVTHYQVESSAVVKASVPVLAQAAAQIGDVQVRNRGTLGGSVAHADPAADYPAVLLATGAEIDVRGGGGARTIAAADFFRGLFWTDLADDEIITHVRVPKPGAGTGSAYLKFPQPASRFALVGCAAVVTVVGGICRDARIAFTGVAGAPFVDRAVGAALIGEPVDADTLDRAAAEAATGVADVLSDLHASADYRRHLARVYARRALAAALAAV